MRRIKRTAFVLVAMMMSALLTTSCTKNDETTITLLGQEKYIDDIIDVIPDTLLTVFNNNFRIHRGYIPPNVEGAYRFSPKKRKISSVPQQYWPLSTIEPDVDFKFEDQHNRMATFSHYEELTTKTDTVYVIGHDTYFTTYYIEDINLDYGFGEVKYKRGIIYSGRMKKNGIGTLAYASIIMEVEDYTNGHVDTYPVGSFFLYEDGDGLAEEIEWNH